MVLATFPVVAAATGSVVGAWQAPGERVKSGVQHLAAGVVFAAVAGELLPDLRRRGDLPVVVAGFAAGVAVLLAMRAVGRRVEDDGSSTVPAGMIAAIGIDLLIDGLLVGIAVHLGHHVGAVLTVALTLEVLFLGLSLYVELVEHGARRSSAILAPPAVALALPAGAVLGAWLLAGAAAPVMTAVVAFGAAALLYLVTEELLVEAHEVEETAAMASMFFVGFIVLFVVQGII